jgi:hypothetical protein
MTHRHRRHHPRSPRPKKAAPITVSVTLPAPVVKPVVTWQAKGRRVLITIRDFFIG